MERALVQSDFPRETFRAVAMAYRERRQAGKMDLPARRAAEEAHRGLHPLAVVAQMIAVAAREYPKWFWKGVGGKWPPGPDAYRT